jgi:hypothetical protein
LADNRYRDYCNNKTIENPQKRSLAFHGVEMQNGKYVFTEEKKAERAKHSGQDRKMTAEEFDEIKKKWAKAKKKAADEEKAERERREESDEEEGEEEEAE